MELKQVVCENTLMVYIEGLVNDYIQKEFSYIQEIGIRLYIAVFNLVVKHHSKIGETENDKTIRFEIGLTVDCNFKYFNTALMYSKNKKIVFAKDIYTLVIHCSKQDFTKSLKPYTTKNRCEKQDCDGCECEK